MSRVATATVEFTLNGRPVSVEVPEDASLLELLRDVLGETSVKDGCAPEGSCGACTVLVDGRATVSCAQAAVRARGRRVVTPAGLPPERRQLWADCFVAAGASQCGFCSPGIVMKAESLLARNPRPTREEVARALAGNLCRCTGYVKILDAVELAAGVGQGGPRPAPEATGRVGTRTPRYQGRELALGEKPYVADLRVPGMLHGALRFSDHPRARVLRIDASRAALHPGVVAVVTAADVPGERRQGLITRDWRQFVAEGEVAAYVGDVLAAVAAETPRAAREAAALVEVEYEVLDPVTDPEDALRGDAPLIHEGGNVLSVSRVRRGDAEAAIAEAPVVLTESFHTGFVEHAFLEPEAALVDPRGGGFHVYSQGQGPWDDRRQVASFLGLPVEAVRVTQVSNGGAFGAKEDLGVQCHTALLALRTGRPVLTVLSREESLRFHAKRHPMRMTYTVAADREGRLLAVRARIVGDTGAYASVGDKVLERAAGHACGPYRVPHVDVEAMAVYTNNPPAGAMRGFGVPQVNFAMEGMMDLLAEAVGLDGWEVRWRNACETGDRFATGQILGPGVGLKATLLAVRDVYREARARGKAVGIACGVKNTGVGNGLTEYGKVILRPEADGTLTLFHSWTEMGQGVHTALQQIACEELGLPPDRIEVVVDTERDLDTGQCTASRSTVLGGRAVIEAATKLREALAGRSLEELAGREFPGVFVVDRTYRPGEGPDGGATHFAYGWATQVVLLDEEGRVERVVAAHDVGRVINPTLLEGQIEGAIHMGLGHALTEEFLVEGGVPRTTTLKSLGIIPAARMPAVECIFVEEPQPEGPYGAKGVGEIGLVPTASAIRAALRVHDGTFRTRLPMRDSPAARWAVPRLISARRGGSRKA